MIWMVALALLAALAVVATFAPVEALGRARRLGLRADGSPSARRAHRERGHARRAVGRGVVLPLAALAALGTAMVLVDTLVPWTRLAVVFGGVTPETDLVSEELVDAFRQDERDAALIAAWTGEAEVRPRGIVPFLLDHWPVNLAFALALLAALWRVYQQAVRERRVYETGVRMRRQEYARWDTRKRDARPRDAPPH